MRLKFVGELLVIIIVTLLPPHVTSASPPAWRDTRLSPDERARAVLRAMMLDEKLAMLHGSLGQTLNAPGREPVLPPPEAIPAAGYVPGVARLGIPALFETDASLGVSNSPQARPGDVATALPAGLDLAASFDPQLAYRAGALVGAEARAKGFDVLLGGGMNLARDPRNGRNFEYLGEDPWLAGLMAAAEVRGTQDQHVISTVKHFVLNANETNRFTLNARISPAALRESDLLAFEIAIERGSPGAVMCGYNQVNGEYSCGNRWLLDAILKRDWGYRGWVMSDWGAVHATDYAIAGLDQESGAQLDSVPWFAAPLAAAVRDGSVSMGRIDDMVLRILRSMFAVGVVDHPPAAAPIDYKVHAATALEIARSGIVLLKNAGVLPITRGSGRIAIIGGEANVGVLSGGGSSQVIPSNGVPLEIPVGGQGARANLRQEIFFPSAPLTALQAALPAVQWTYDSGAFPAEAAMLAGKSDLAIVFVTRHEFEGRDIPNLNLPNGQDQLIAAVAAANPNTVVVLEAGNPVAMPWLTQVKGVVAAWYPGQEGGQAIADVLVGSVNPSGRLPITFPIDDSQTVRPALPNFGSDRSARVVVDYSEGADVGYRWYARRRLKPLFAFGEGLSYTTFAYRDLRLRGGSTITASFEVENTGSRAGADVPQLYLVSAAGKEVFRLIGFERVELEPGERREITVAADRRWLGSFDDARHAWQISAGAYRVRVSRSAIDPVLEGEATVAAGLIRSAGERAEP